MININEFPDDILTRILSFLPYKHAVRTTILSERWKPLFHSLDVLNIDDEGTDIKKYWYGFCEFMDKNMFSRHSQNVSLKSFHLKCNHRFWDARADCWDWDASTHSFSCTHKLSDVRADSFSLNNWIIAAKQRGIEHLNLCYFNALLVPTTVFSCKTLVVLKLMDMHIENMYCCSVDLPSLKTLDLQSVSFHDMENLIRLISGCPILENLKTFYVKAKAGVAIREHIKPLSKLIKADMHLFQVPFKAVCNVQFLSIRQTGVFPVIGNLTDLQLDWLDEKIGDWDDIVKILQNCSNLQTLKIKKCDKATTKQDWKCPVHVPECVSSHLTTCRIDGYDVLNADFRFVTFILKKAILLQDMSIFPVSYPKLMASPRYLQDLFSCPRISPACKLYVSGFDF